MAIQYLRGHLLEELGRRDLNVNEKEIFYVLTVPAIWEDSAKQFMREAAIKAGIDGNRLKLSLEPEAAAIWCGRKDPTITGSSVNLGTKFMVVDIGGGTADMVVQERQIDGSIKNLLKSTGGPWGGTYVDDNFLKTLIDITGQYTFDRWKTGHMDDYFDLLMNFETKKRFLDVYSEQTVVMKIPYTLFETSEKEHGKSFEELIAESCHAECILRRGKDRLQLNVDIVRGWFDDPIKQIIKHIRHVLAITDVRTLMLVGGFSESKYVQDRIQKGFPDKHLLLPQEAGLVVVKGAVLFGFQPDIIASRVMGCTYGMALDTTSKSNIFVVFVRIGDEVPLGYAITEHDLRLTNSHFTDVEIYRSPEYNPKLITDDRSECFGTLNIPHPPRLGQRYRDRLVDVTFIFGDTELEVSVLIKSTGQTCRLRINCLA